MTPWLQEAERIGRLLVEHYADRDGLVPFRVDVATGKVLDPVHLSEELGDYVQNLYALGEALGEERFKTWAIEHVLRSAERFQTPEGVFLIGGQRRRARALTRVLLPFRNADTINGLSSLYHLSKDERLRPVLLRFFQGVDRLATRSGGLPYLVIPMLGSGLPGAAPLGEAFISEEAALFEGDGIPEIGRRWLDRLLAPEHRTAGGLFAARRYPRRGVSAIGFEAIQRLRKRLPARAAELTKGNAYILFAILAHYRRRPEPALKSVFEQWMDQAINVFQGLPGTTSNVWIPGRGPQGGARLSHAHSFIELYLDAASVFAERRWIDHAEEVARFWLPQRGRTGLVREFAFDQNRPEAMLDPNGDLATDLFKLATATGKSEYRRDAFSLMDALVERLRQPFGVAGEINAQTGFVTDTRLETKFLGLFVKNLVLAHHVGEGRSLLGDPRLWLLARDR